jgi:predicted transcriptional regulator
MRKIFERSGRLLRLINCRTRTIEYAKSIAKEGETIEHSLTKLNRFGLLQRTKNRLLENRIRNRMAQKCGNSL